MRITIRVVELLHDRLELARHPAIDHVHDLAVVMRVHGRIPQQLRHRNNPPNLYGQVYRRYPNPAISPSLTLSKVLSSCLDKTDPSVPWRNYAGRLPKA